MRISLAEMREFRARDHVTSLKFGYVRESNFLI